MSEDVGAGEVFGEDVFDVNGPSVISHSASEQGDLLLLRPRPSLISLSFRMVGRLIFIYNGITIYKNFLKSLIRYRKAICMHMMKIN